MPNFRDLSAYQQKSGMGHTPAYQVSSKPYATASLTIPPTCSAPLEIEFPYITSFITVRNTLSTAASSVPLRFGWSENGVNALENTNYIVLNNGEAYSGKWKCTKLYLLSDIATPGSGAIIAGLTSIETKNLPENWSGSIGVG